MRLILDISINVVELLFICYFFYKYFEVKQNVNFKDGILLFAFGAIIIFGNAMVSVELRGVFNVCVSILIFFPMLWKNTKGNKLEKLYVSIFVYGLLSLIETSVSILISVVMYRGILLDLVFREYQYPTKIISYFLFLVIGLFLARKRKELPILVSTKATLILVLMSSASMLAYICLDMILVSNEFSVEIVTTSLLSLIIVNIFIFISFFMLHKDGEEILKNELGIQALKYQSNLMESSYNAFQNIARLENNLNVFLLDVECLLEGGEKQEILNKINMYSIVIDDSEKVIITNNDTLNFILNTKYKMAKNKGVNICFSLNLGNYLKLNDMDLSILLGNILDNAIENTSSGKEIEMTMKLVDNHTILIVKNPVEGAASMINGEFISTKKEKGHGYGIASIKEVVQKHHGYATFGVENGMFVCQIVL